MEDTISLKRAFKNLADTCRVDTYSLKEQYLKEYLESPSDTFADALEKIHLSMIFLEDSILSLYYNDMHEALDIKSQTNQMIVNKLELRRHITACRGIIDKGKSNLLIDSLKKLNDSYNRIYKTIHDDRLTPNLTDEDKKFIEQLEKDFYSTENKEIREINIELKKHGINDKIKIEDE